MTATSSTARLRLAPAPAGLCLVQDLVNTATTSPASRMPDLLAAVDPARAWLDGALAGWAAATGSDVPQVGVSERDLPALRRLRDDVRALLRSSPVRPLPGGGAGVDVTWDGEGRLRYRPRGVGARAVTSLVAAELLLAQQGERLRRLKCCASEVCSVAFYDQSPNAIRVWHDTAVCGNRHHLRTSRARRTAASDPVT